MTRTPDDITFLDDIEGYPGQLSYLPGETVDLHVSTRAEYFDVRIERWGQDLEEVWSQEGATGEFHAAPDDADARGCGWPANLQISVGDSWRSGFYLVTLTAQGAEQGRETAHAGFVVRAAAANRAKAILVLATNTWNAYNNWGGKSLYTGGNQVSFQRPWGRGMLSRPETDRDDRKARPARWGEEPDTDGEIFQEYRLARDFPPSIGSSGWFTFERRFAEWAEANEFQMDYAVSSDLERDPSVLDGYDLLLSIGHDEYWSADQRNAVTDFVSGGGNLASFSGNTMFWQVRLEDEGQTMVCHKYSAHETDPVTATNPQGMTGMWCDPVVGRPEWELLGGASAFGLYYRFGQSVANGSGGFTVYRDQHWLFEGTGLRYGDLLGAKHGAVGYETMGCKIQFDDFQLPIAAPVDGMPEDVEVVAFVPASSLAMGEYPKSISALSDQGDLEFVASRLYGDLSEDSLARVRYGNAVMLVCRPFGASGGEVVTVGTTDWAFALADDQPVSRVTSNVLGRYLGRDSSAS